MQKPMYMECVVTLNPEGILGSSRGDMGFRVPGLELFRGVKNNKTQAHGT